MKRVLWVVSVAALVAMFGSAAFAVQDHPTEAKKDAPVAQESHAATTDGGSAKELVGFALAFGMAIAAGLGAFSQSRAITTALESVARQPEAGGRLQTMMLIGVVFIETLVLFTWLLFFMWGGTLFK